MQAWEVATEFLRPKDISDPRDTKIHGTLAVMNTHDVWCDVRKSDLANIRTAFDLVNKARRLPVMLEVYMGKFRGLFEHKGLFSDRIYR